MYIRPVDIYIDIYDYDKFCASQRVNQTDKAFNLLLKNRNRVVVTTTLSYPMMSFTQRNIYLSH